MIRIIITQIPECRLTFDPQLLSLLPMNRRAKIERYRRANDKALCFAAGLAVIRSCMDMCDASPSDITLMTEDNHAPYALHKGKKIFAGISHSDRYAAVITDASPCGIDIENKNRDLNALRSAVNFFHFNEKKLLYETSNEYQTELFYFLWTMKEAYLKYLGTGLSKRLDSFYISEEDGRIRIYDEEYASFSEASAFCFNYGNNVISTVSDNDIKSIRAVPFDDFINSINKHI